MLVVFGGGVAGRVGTGGPFAVPLAGVASGLFGSGVSALSGLRIQVTAYGQTTVDLSWTSGGGGLVNYVVQRSLDNSTWTTVATVTTPVYQVTGLSAGSLYYFRVQYVYTTASFYLASVSQLTQGTGSGTTVNWNTPQQWNVDMTQAFPQYYANPRQYLVDPSNIVTAAGLEPTVAWYYADQKSGIPGQNGLWDASLPALGALDLYRVVSVGVGGSIAPADYFACTATFTTTPKIPFNVVCEHRRGVNGATQQYTITFDPA